MALLALTALSITSVGAADTTSAPEEMAQGGFGKGTAGYRQPDSRTGAMTWTYPFDLPPARGGPQPRLLLNGLDATEHFPFRGRWTAELSGV